MTVHAIDELVNLAGAEFDLATCLCRCRAHRTRDRKPRGRARVCLNAGCETRDVETAFGTNPFIGFTRMLSRHEIRAFDRDDVSLACCRAAILRQQRIRSA